MREMIPKKIGKIDFALMGPKEVRKLSATKVITADTYDDDGFPIPMGLMDLHMGVIEPGLRCKTCLLYTSPSPRDVEESRMPSSA